MWIYQRGLCILLLSATACCYPPSQYAYAPAHEEYKETDYSYSYGVKDQHTGDFKHQWEKKDGDKVTGHYSFLEADGSVRSVDYTADKKSGFNAVVKHSGPSHHPQVSKEHPISHSEHPISHSELNLKPKETHELGYSHKPQYSYENKYSHEPQYEIKYFYPDGTEAGPEEAEAAKRQHEVGEQTYRVEQEYDGKQNYVYLPQEESVEESQQSPVKSKFHYQKNHNAHYSDLNTQVTKDQYEKLKAIPTLPVDLSLIKSDASEKVVPVDVSLIKPVEVNVNENKYETSYGYKNPEQQHQQYAFKDTIQPSYELSEEDLNRYIKEYYKPKDSISGPLLETGFKPIRSKTKEAVSQPVIPGTYRTNKKPMTTPGLSTYSSNQYSRRQPNKYNHRSPNLNYSERLRVPHKLPYQYFTNGDKGLRDGRKSQISRLYRTVPDDGYVRYARHINS